MSENRRKDRDYYIHQYMTGQVNPTDPDVINQYVVASDAVLSQSSHQLDIHYGLHPRERLDIFYAEKEPLGTIVYFHAGYWQSRDKVGFRFLASDFVKQGYNFVLVNYPLCPDVNIAAIVASARKAVLHVFQNLKIRHPQDKGLILSGHSAGGHIAVELALDPWPEAPAATPIEAIFAISGIYDLSPLVQTPLNDKLRMTLEDAMAYSPLFRVRNMGVNAFFVVGELETEQFQLQSQAMADAWRQAGNPAKYHALPDSNHFNILQKFHTAANVVLAEMS